MLKLDTLVNFCAIIDIKQAEVADLSQIRHKIAKNVIGPKWGQ